MKGWSANSSEMLPINAILSTVWDALNLFSLPVEAALNLQIFQLSSELAAAHLGVGNILLSLKILADIVRSAAKHTFERRNRLQNPKTEMQRALR